VVHPISEIRSLRCDLPPTAFERHGAFVPPGTLVFKSGTSEIRFGIGLPLSEAHLITDAIEARFPARPES